MSSLQATKIYMYERKKTYEIIMAHVQQTDASILFMTQLFWVHRIKVVRFTKKYRCDETKKNEILMTHELRIN